MSEPSAPKPGRPAGWGTRRLVLAGAACLLLLAGLVGCQTWRDLASLMPGATHAKVDRFYRPVQFTVGPQPVNVRNGPGAKFHSLGGLEAGSQVTALGRTMAANGASWLMVRYGYHPLAFINERLVVGPGGTSSLATSFNCVQAHEWAERAICSDTALAKADRDLSLAYSRQIALHPGPDQEALRASQRAWIVTRNACVTDPQPTDCVAKAYQARIAALAVAAP
ncbi:lysozyme inhibitor LprI family protein [Phenylobacterium aquaticum]|uniref:lysozyme inhibitor LprI family protein n=1 Tax=Phenylobacterium aquaticum TaxID=1763816 RepID=UPI0026F3057D|nr:lysozyme inhibitor LprI family protein [Phenylobacterium aquaticum]